MDGLFDPSDNRLDYSQYWQAAGKRGDLHLSGKPLRLTGYPAYLGGKGQKAPEL